MAISYTKRPEARDCGSIHFLGGRALFVVCNQFDRSSSVINSLLPPTSRKTFTLCRSALELLSNDIASPRSSKPPNNGCKGRIAEMDKGLRLFTVAVSFLAVI